VQEHRNLNAHYRLKLDKKVFEEALQELGSLDKDNKNLPYIEVEIWLKRKIEK